MKWPSLMRWLVALVVSALLVGAVLWFAEPREIWRVLRRADGRWLAVGVVTYVGVLVARWVRLVGLVDKSGLSWHRLELLWVSAGHSFATHLLPVRSGEIAFPFLWRRTTGQSVAEGAVFLTAIRVVELGIVVPLYGLGLGVWLAGTSSIQESGWLVGLLVVLGGVLLVGLPAMLRVGLRLVRWCLVETRLEEVEVLEPLREAVPEAGEAIERLGRGRRLWLVGTSLAMWLLMFGVFYAITAACGVDLGLAQVVVGSGGGILGNMLPIGGIGSLGTMEAGWTAAFEATGAPTAPIVAAGMIVHALVIVGNGLGALVGYCSR